MDGFAATLKSIWSALPTVLGMVAAFFGTVLSVVRLYESRTFQHWKNNWLLKHRARVLARLQKRAKITAARIQALQNIRIARTEAREIVEKAHAEAACITEKTALAEVI